MTRHLTLKGGTVLWPGGLAGDDLHMAEGRLVDAPGRGIDARGYLVLPGIVDLHGDGFERHLAPRRGALESLEVGLISVEAELAANGITTAYLAQFMSWEGGMRGPDLAEDLAQALLRGQFNLDLRLQLRLEIGFPEVFDRAARLVAQGLSHYVVFNDHLPHDALAQGRRPPRLVGQAMKAGHSPDAHHALLQRLHDGMPGAEARLAELARDLSARGVTLGSHDAAQPDAWQAHHSLGCHICEFPETADAALAARETGSVVVMGAPNVVRGGSHDKKVAAQALIADGIVDALVSDYHYPALYRAALRLWRDGMGLEQAWHLISAGPSGAMGLTDRGTLALGNRADVVVLCAQTHRIEGVFCAGCPTHLSGSFAQRVLDEAHDP
ncbi:MAG: alpha-D-ribose 1-methylphosphonate 5-triphosphate diphosphatase [Pseudomonadota bacterium]